MRRLSRPLVGRLSTLATIEEDSGDSNSLHEHKHSIINPEEKENELPESLVALLDAAYEQEIRRASLPPAPKDSSLLNCNSSFTSGQNRITKSAGLVSNGATSARIPPPRKSRISPGPPLTGCVKPVNKINMHRRSLVSIYSDSAVPKESERSLVLGSGGVVQNTLAKTGVIGPRISGLSSSKSQFRRKSLVCPSMALTPVTNPPQHQHARRRHTLMEVPQFVSVKAQPKVTTIRPSSSRSTAARSSLINTAAVKRPSPALAPNRVSLNPVGTKARPKFLNSQTNEPKNSSNLHGKKVKSDANPVKRTEPLRPPNAATGIPSYLRPTKASLAKAKIRNNNK